MVYKIESNLTHQLGNGKRAVKSPLIPFENNVNKSQMTVVCALVYNKAPSYSCRRGCPAPSPARFARGRRPSAHTKPDKPKNRAPKKDLLSKNFLGRGDATAQIGQFATANCLKDAVCSDEAPQRGAEPPPADPLGVGFRVLPRARAFSVYHFSACQNSRRYCAEFLSI